MDIGASEEEVQRPRVKFASQYDEEAKFEHGFSFQASNDKLAHALAVLEAVE